MAIVGAGTVDPTFSGALRQTGHNVWLLYKGRAADGHMWTRQTDTPFGEANFDHEFQYFAVRDLSFRAAFREWQAAGLLAAP